MTVPSWDPLCVNRRPHCTTHDRLMCTTHSRVMCTTRRRLVCTTDCRLDVDRMASVAAGYGILFDGLSVGKTGGVPSFSFLRLRCL